MPKRLDHTRICAMGRTGIPTAIIAERLGCSEKSVSRVLYVNKIVHQPSDLVGTDDEWMLWEEWRSMGDKPSRVAYRFGYSRQHMTDYFSKPRVLSGGELA